MTEGERERLKQLCLNITECTSRRIKSLREMSVQREVSNERLMKESGKDWRICN